MAERLNTFNKLLFIVFFFMASLTSQLLRPLCLNFYIVDVVSRFKLKAWCKLIYIMNWDQDMIILA